MVIKSEIVDYRTVDFIFLTVVIKVVPLKLLLYGILGITV